ncbi:MAG: class I SAM-dependent methyltransferase [Spirochaetes bacterium]|nr:class I SAM-dependent methyltransferase [Spirochaetota bacterium]
MKKKIREIIKWFIYLFRLNGFFFKRDFYSIKYLKGRGLEIGALNRPLFVKKNVSVDYVDKITREEALRYFKDDNISINVEPTIIDDGFVLGKVDDRSYDFLIANHVLEHSSNFFQTIVNWSRVLKIGGVLYLVVPIADMCFDRGRKITGLEHFIDDYGLVKNGNTKEFKIRNRDHWREMFTISEPNNRIQKGLEPITYPAGLLEKLIDEKVESDEDTHFHTFSNDSFRRAVEYFISEIDRGFEIAAYDRNKDELICILRKTRYDGRNG